mgnify:CR=1 FL=1
MYEKIYLNLVPRAQPILLLLIMGSGDLEKVITRLSILFISCKYFYRVFLCRNFCSVVLLVEISLM